MPHGAIAAPNYILQCVDIKAETIPFMLLNKQTKNSKTIFREGVVAASSLEVTLLSIYSPPKKLTII